MIPGPTPFDGSGARGYSAVMNDVTTTTRLGQFLQSLHAVESRLEAALEPGGLSLAKFGVLAQLEAAGEPLPLSTLAERRACVRSNITQLVDRLEADGLVRRVRDASDRRAVKAEVTSLGRERQTAGAKEVAKVQGELARTLAGASPDALRRALSTLT